MTDLIEILEARVRQHQVELVMILQPSHRLQHIGGGQGLDHVVDGEAIGQQARRIDIHAVLGLLSAEDADAGHAVDRRKQRHQLILGDVAQPHRIDCLRSQAVGGHGKHGGIHPPRGEAGARWQRRQHLVDCRLDLLQGQRHVAAPVEVDGKIGRAATGGGADIAHARHRSHSDLHRTRHRNGHLIGGPVAGLQRHPDPREVHVRKQGHRQVQAGGGATQGQERQQRQQRPAVIRRPARQTHRGTSRTGSPSFNS